MRDDQSAPRPTRAPRTGTIYPQKNRRGFTVGLDYVDPLTKRTRQRSATVDDYEEGEKLLARWLRLTGEQHADEVGSMTVAGLAMRWLDEVDPRIDRTAVSDHRFTEDAVLLDTWRGYESEIATHILPGFGRTALSAADDIAVGAYLATLAASKSRRKPIGATTAPPLSASMILKVYRRLHQIFTYGVKRKLIVGHPMIGMKPPKAMRRSEEHVAERDPAERAIEWEDLDLMLAWLHATYPEHPAYRTRVRTGGETGLRQAEACGLTWDRVDLRRRTIRVLQQLVYVEHEHGCAGKWAGRKVSPCTLAARAASGNPKLAPIAAYRCPYRRDGGWYIDTDTKSHQRRTVPISKGLAADLAELRHARTPLPDADAKRRRLARRASRYAVVNADLVFTAQRGGHISKSLDNTLIHRAFDGAEIEADGRNVHSLRHTAATTMIRAGIPLPEIQVILGHSSLQMLERYYSGVTARTATADSVSAFVDVERRERMLDASPHGMVLPDGN